MGLRVATWNVYYRKPSIAAKMGKLLQEEKVDLVLLQEANPNSLDALRQAAGLDWAVTAFDAGVEKEDLPSGRRRVTAIAGRGKRPLKRNRGVLRTLRLEERMVFASVATEMGDLTVASYHAPPGVSWGGITKVQHAHELLTWVNTTPGLVVVGADANTPEIDHPDPARVRTHSYTGRRNLYGAPGDDVMFGGTPQHRLRDAYRQWLDKHPDMRADITREHPDGPLAVSHRTGKRKNSSGQARRFDALWISPEFSVRSAKYDYDGAVTAGSDHALFVAELTTIQEPAQ